MMNENEILMKRLIELSHRAFERGYNTFSEFLNLDEISDMTRLKLDTPYKLYGGYNSSERCVAGFGDNIEEYDFPIVCIKIAPVSQKFADKLNHRDFLGSLMNLGINRNVLGDIKIHDNVGYLFCLESIGNYIIDSVSRIKHTTVKYEAVNDIPDFINKLPEAEEIITSSLRADAVICSVFKLSRNQASLLFRQEKVFINSKTAHKESIILKKNDVVSVRGFGKFIFEEAIRETKKGRLIASVRIYR